MKSGADSAKAIVWAFIAGFSEQFVPNILDKLAQQGESAVDSREAAEPGEQPQQAG